MKPKNLREKHMKDEEKKTGETFCEPIFRSFPKSLIGLANFSYPHRRGYLMSRSKRDITLMDHSALQLPLHIGRACQKPI